MSVERSKPCSAEALAQRWGRPSDAPGLLVCVPPLLYVHLAAVLLVALTTSPLSTHATTYTVTTNADSGPGSLRQDIAIAANGDVITFAGNVIGAITLTNGELSVGKNMAIVGPGPGFLSVSGNNSSCVFEILSGTTLS